MPVFRLHDPADPRLDDYRNVPDAAMIERRGIFVAEGRLIVTRLLEQERFAVRSVMVTDAALAALSVPPGRPAASALPIYVVPPAIMDTVAGFPVHRGCLAIGERPAPARWQDVAAAAQRLVVVERVANADNIGAIFRNAAAFGADAVLLDASATDPLYRKAIRTSMGAVLRLPFARLAPWPAALHDLRAAGWSIVALTPGAAATLAEAVPAPRTTGQAPPRIALLVGHEGDGLSDAALAACDARARIPMADGMDSLNVATACAIALYHLAAGEVAAGARLHHLGATAAPATAPAADTAEVRRG